MPADAAALGLRLRLRAPLAGRGLCHLAATQAPGADGDAPHRALDERPHPLQVGLHRARGHIVRMTDVAPENSLLATDCAFLGHIRSLLRGAPEKGNVRYQRSTLPSSRPQLGTASARA